MVEIVGIRFKKVGKTYYFDPDGKKFELGDKVIVETARGVEMGEISIENRMVADEKIIPPLKKVMRAASPKDLEQVIINEHKQEEAFRICKEKIEKHKLEMKLLEVEYTFDRSKILFYFTADGRVDFRELVKDLASVFKTRIELRQIGVRDEAKFLKGIGVCGRPFCCTTFLGDFQPVSIKMAKDQNLSLNSSKNSGGCGWLMCCLNYEQSNYEKMWKVTPRPRSIVETPQGRGMVIDVNILKGTLRVLLDSNGTVVPFTVKEIRIVKNAETEIDKETLKELKKMED